MESINYLELLSVFTKANEAHFEQFSDSVSRQMLDMIFHSIEHVLKTRLEADGTSASVVTPWGTYTARRRVAAEGDSANTAIDFEVSKGFLSALNSDSKKAEDLQEYVMAELDEDLTKAARDYGMYGFFDPEDPKNKDKVANAKKGIYLLNHQIPIVFDNFAAMLVQLARTKCREGKQYRVDMTNGFGHGLFDFDCANDSISVKFTADKAFKQYLKDDAATAGEVA